jgi:RNA polymerase sigma-70 factor (ECF subfamily)
MLGVGQRSRRRWGDQLAAHPSEYAEARSAAAAALLYQSHAPRVLRFCLRFLRNRQDAEDAVQTTFLRAHGALERGALPQAEEAWLITIARNVCLSQVESARRRSSFEVGCEPTDLEAAPAPERNTTLMGIKEALASMPAAQRRAILLREWKGLSYREVAAELGTTQAAVEALLFRARRSLAGALEDTGSTLRRRASGLASFPFLGSLKSALGGASAAKLVASTAAVAVVTAAVVAPVRILTAESTRAAKETHPAAASSHRYIAASAEMAIALTSGHGLGAFADGAHQHATAFSLPANSASPTQSPTSGTESTSGADAGNSMSPALSDVETILTDATQAVTDLSLSSTPDISVPLALQSAPVLSDAPAIPIAALPSTPGIPAVPVLAPAPALPDVSGNLPPLP